MTSREYLLLGFAAIVVVGVAAQWIAWRTKLPAILLLLAAGLLAGPVAQMSLGWKLIDPQVIIGDLIYPIVSLSVAIILFEGSLTLNIAELRQVGGAVRNLVTLGMLITWAVTTVAAHFVLRLPWDLSLLLGAILSVTGPTVIGPLLRHIQPIGRVGPTLKWEGIVIDPIGAVLALLVFEAIAPESAKHHVAVSTTMTLLKTVGIGGAIGLAAAGVLVLILRRFWLADYLQNPVTLALVFTAFVGANLLQDEAGLLAVTAMGIALGNQKSAPYRHILEFKEALTVLLVSCLFIIVGSQLQPAQLTALGWQTAAFVAVLLIVGRPLAVFASTLGTGLALREKIFISSMAPRGVVAAAVSSIFALRLKSAGFEGADRIVPTAFAVIILTVTIYGLLSPLLARKLGLAKPGATGFLIASAHPLARLIAKELLDEGEVVAMVDTNRANLAEARLLGLTTYPMSVLSEELLEALEGTGIRQLLAMTPSDDVNSLAAVHFARVFGRSNVYQLEPETLRPVRTEKTRVSHELHGRVLFRHGMTFEKLRQYATDGVSLKRTGLTGEFTFKNFIERSPEALPLFIRSATGEVSVVTADVQVDPKPGQTLITLVPSHAVAHR